jgi:hypothetical protein
MPSCKCGCGAEVQRTWFKGHNRKGQGNPKFTAADIARLRSEWTEAGIPYGECLCGCGRQTNIASRSVTDYGHIKGEPLRFILGHGYRKPTKFLPEDRGHSTPCWIWQLWTTHDGYGRYNSKMAHRVIWEEVNGPIPAGMQLDHLCCQPSCVNPDHLEVVTNAENSRRGSTTKLDWDKVREIRRCIADEGATHKALAERHGVCVATISHIASGRNWRE